MIREESIRIPFRYAAGRAGSAFLAALRHRKQLVASRCVVCARTFVPARPYCPDCGAEDLAAVDVGPGAALVSWTEQPGLGVFALVRPDGADTAMLHKLIGATEGLCPGLRLRAVFAAERKGHIADLEGFERDRGAVP
jgi:uncharacterized OB-fold protein